MVRIFVNGSVSYLENAINAWLADGNVLVKSISYAIDINQNYYSALVYYVVKPDTSGLVIHR
jgi:hypothetical protein